MNTIKDIPVGFATAADDGDDGDDDADDDAEKSQEDNSATQPPNIINMPAKPNNIT